MRWKDLVVIIIIIIMRLFYSFLKWCNNKNLFKCIAYYRLLNWCNVYIPNVPENYRHDKKTLQVSYTAVSVPSFLSSFHCSIIF